MLEAVSRKEVCPIMEQGDSNIVKADFEDLQKLMTTDLNLIIQVCSCLSLEPFIIASIKHLEQPYLESL